MAEVVPRQQQNLRNEIATMNHGTFNETCDLQAYCLKHCHNGEIEYKNPMASFHIVIRPCVAAAGVLISSRITR